MADYRAVSTVCQSVVNFLRTSYEGAGFGNELEFKVYLSKDFAQPIAAGVSLFLYRVVPNGTHRIPRGRATAEGRRQMTQLPVDAHFLLTAWGKEASLQHEVLGWTMRTLEDYPILTATLLNAVTANVFRPDETVELVLGEMPNEDMFRIWETLAENLYQISVPYIARNIWIESRRQEQVDPRIDKRATVVSVPD